MPVLTPPNWGFNVVAGLAWATRASPKKSNESPPGLNRGSDWPRNRLQPSPSPPSALGRVALRITGADSDLQTVIDAAYRMLRTLMKDARGGLFR